MNRLEAQRSTSRLVHATCTMIRYSGLPWLIRRRVARRRASVVLYHDPSPASFEAHLAFLSKHYRFISLDTLVDALYAQDWSKVPEYALVITLDDGHARNAELVEIARRYEAHPTIFLCSQVVGTARQFWFNAPPDQAEVERLKYLPDSQRLEQLAERWDFDPTRDHPSQPADALSRGDLAAMKETFHFGSHSRFHPTLPTCDEASLREELELSKGETAELAGSDCLHFAYPNGDYTEREVEAVRRAGYRSARTIDVGWTDLGSDPFRLKITGISDDAPLDMVVAQLSGITRWIRDLVRKALGRRFSWC